MWRQVQGHPRAFLAGVAAHPSGYVHIHVYAHQRCNPRASPSRQTQDVRDFLWRRDVRHHASALRWYGDEREQEPTTYGLQNSGAPFHSVPLGSVQTSLAEFKHILLSRVFRCVPFRQRVLLAVLLADESVPCQSNRAPKSGLDT